MVKAAKIPHEVDEKDSARTVPDNSPLPEAGYPVMTSDQVLAALPYAICVLEHQSNNDLLVLHTNPRMEAIIGSAGQGDEPLPLGDISDLAYHPDFKDALSITLSRDRKGAFDWCADVDQTPVLLHGEMELITTSAIGPNGGANGGPDRIVLTLSEIEGTANAGSNAIAHKDGHDLLTGLPDYATFISRLRDILTYSKGMRPATVLSLNLDRFQQINESLGFDTGDNVLITAARRIKDVLPTGSLLSRFICDEFTIFAPGMKSDEEARKLADRIHTAIKTPMPLGECTVHISAAIGIAHSTPTLHGVEDLVRNAIMAMHKAKATGIGSTATYSQDLRKHAQSQFTLEADLRKAIQNRELELHYQPICNMISGEITGFEALTRWNHPERGPVSPVEFIPLAEQSGLILPLGAWALHEACRQMAEWDHIPGLDQNLIINVNVSGIQFSEPGFIDSARQALNDSGLDGRRLRLEITESTLMSNADLVADLLLDLKALGLQLAIDDFGTGYSSLSYLNRFPIDTLKIDRSFTQKLDDKSGDAKIVHIITTLAQTMGMTTVAEGIETKEQREQLSQLGCQMAQGYLFARPLSADSATELLKSGKSLP
jgi:diguanylate cyclase (GGDEF)-like protein